MRAARLADKCAVEIVELDEPRPGPGEVLLRVLLCGICGSDLHLYRGRWPGSGSLGHEFCATVEQAGPGVRGFERGTRVVGEGYAHCGECASCRRGDWNQCKSLAWDPGRPAGGMAEWLVYPAGSLVTVPEELTDRQASMVEPCAVAFRALARAGVRTGQSVVVIGGGTMGLLCACVASAEGASPVWLVAKHAHQARKAAELSVATPLLAADGDPRQVIEKATDGRGVDVAIDSVAAGTSLSVALSLTARKGRLVEVGGVTRPLMVALNALVEREIEITGSSCYAVTDGRRDFEWAMDLIAQGRLSPQKLITHTFPLEEAAEAFRVAADKRTGSIKVLVTMQS